MDLWILVFLLVVVQPVFGWWRFRKFVARGGTVATPRKLRLYFIVLLTQWSLTALCAWVMSRRHLNIADLGLLKPGPAWAWILAGVLATMLATATIIAVRSIRAGKSEMPGHLLHVARILPQNLLERIGFTPVALTAGTCEETLYRGFLTFAFYQAYPSMILALALSTVAFGMGHLYQGPRGILSTMALGLVLAALYWGSGSLWPGIALHALVDLANGNALGSLVSRPPHVVPAPVVPYTADEAGDPSPPERTTGT
jgi:membrane protease YdiL (CAAX protease family)